MFFIMHCVFGMETIKFVFCLANLDDLGIFLLLTKLSDLQEHNFGSRLSELLQNGQVEPEPSTSWAVSGEAEVPSLTRSAPYKNEVVPIPRLNMVCQAVPYPERLRFALWGQRKTLPLDWHMNIVASPTQHGLINYLFLGVKECHPIHLFGLTESLGAY